MLYNILRNRKKPMPVSGYTEQGERVRLYQTIHMLDNIKTSKKGRPPAKRHHFLIRSCMVMPYNTYCHVSFTDQWTQKATRWYKGVERRRKWGRKSPTTGPAITNCVSLQLEYYVPENAEGGQITGVCVRVWYKVEINSICRKVTFLLSCLPLFLSKLCSFSTVFQLFGTDMYFLFRSAPPTNSVLREFFTT